MHFEDGSGSGGGPQARTLHVDSNRNNRYDLNNISYKQGGSVMSYELLASPHPEGTRRVNDVVPDQRRRARSEAGSKVGSG